MMPSAYCNLEARGMATQGHGVMIAPLWATAMSVLHPYFAAHPDTFALDFPELQPGASARKPPHLGQMLRVFAATREGCEALMDHLERHPVAEYLSIGRIRGLGKLGGPWVSLHRVRIAPRGQPDNRRRDLANQETSPSPFIRMRSRGNGHHFSLMLERRRRDSLSYGVPNSYGLSSEQWISLPDIQV